MPFSWARYNRAVAGVFLCTVIIGFVATSLVRGDLPDPAGLLILLINGAVLAVVAAFPLSGGINYGSGRSPRSRR